MIKMIGRFFKICLLLLWLIGSTTWVALAVNFGDSNSSTVQIVISVTLTLIGLTATVTLLFVPFWRKKMLLVHGFIFLTVLLWWLNIQPANDRLWQADVTKLAYASVKGDLVTVHNIRNFTYRSEFDYKPNYYDKTFDLNKLEGIDLFAVYWMGPVIAHIFISFDFGEHNHLAISIEARKEEGEGYSTIKGFFRQYELIYIVADERDVIGLRTHYRKDPPEQVYRYRLKVPKQNAKRLFKEYIDSVNALYKAPAFYNTLLANCTSVIWLHSRVNPEHLPFSWKILLSGYVPEYLYESGRLDQKLSFTQLKDQAYVNPLIEGQEISELFTQAIRP
jgi:hypothetical protein